MKPLHEMTTRKVRWFNEAGAGDGTHEYGVFFEVEDGREIAVSFHGLDDASAKCLQEALASLPALMRPATVKAP